MRRLPPNLKPARPRETWLSSRRTLGVLGIALASAIAHTARATPPPVDYTRQVRRLLARRCFACHGALKQEAGLRLDAGSLARKGGSRGRVILPGDAEGSRLIARVAAADAKLRMPPEGEPPLTPAEVETLRQWIAQGARSPAGEQPGSDPRRHWAFLPPALPTAPRVRNKRWVRNPVDAFVAAEHEKRGLTPAPPASREVLLRRVYLDLTGLPPTREERHAFLADRSPDAYEQVVDRLLASPRYGERWGRHWMDVWRYSDWYGRRMQADVRNSYGQVWRWRDWIVKSLNQDKGYDRMVTEMLAADEVAPTDPEALAATGFLVRNWYSLNYNQWMRDNVEHTGKAFLGLTLNCAHCHDHKYDPISQNEYFRFRAFFEPLELRHDRWPGDEDPGPFKKYVYGGSTAALKSGMIRVFDEKLDAKTVRYLRGDERNIAAGEPPLEPGAPAVLGGDRLRVEPVELPAAAYYPGLQPFVQQEEVARREKALSEARGFSLPEPARVAAAEADLAAVRARIAADNARYGGAGGSAEELARAAGKAERLAALRAAELQVLLAERAAQEARRKAPAGAPAPALMALQQAEAKLAAARAALEQAKKATAAEDAKYTPLSPLYPTKSTGRRRALAAWITSSRNPLTARVAVNHIWMRHFGRPLVDTVFDFGRNGKPPSNPALLDYLAARFAGVPSSGLRVPGSAPANSEPGTRNSELSSAWSMKALHRLIVTSNTYRMASSVSAEAARANARVDRDDRFLWRFQPRRLEAEAVRDSILHAARLLDPAMGGPELDNLQEDTRRRSLYYSVYAEDGGAMRFLATFDAPDTCDAYRRTESIVPQQALALTNSRLTRDACRAVAGKLWQETGARPVPARRETLMGAAFEQVLTRRPSTRELRLCRDFLERQEALYRSVPTPPAPAAGGAPEPGLRALESLVQALFSHHDFLNLR